MSWITEIPREEATGLLRRELDAAVERAGRVWNIVQVMSLNAPVLRNGAAIVSHTHLPGAVVSAELDCFYINAGARARPPGRGQERRVG